MKRKSRKEARLSVERRENLCPVSVEQTLQDSLQARVKRLFAANFVLTDAKICKLGVTKEKKFTRGCMPRRCIAR